MTMPDSGPLIARLIASAQSGLADAVGLTHSKRRRDLIAAAQVQADCALALAIDRLATAVEALVFETPDDN